MAAKIVVAAVGDMRTATTIMIGATMIMSLLVSVTPMKTVALVTETGTTITILVIAMAMAMEAVVAPPVVVMTAEAVVALVATMTTDAIAIWASAQPTLFRALVIVLLIWLAVQSMLPLMWPAAALNYSVLRHGVIGLIVPVTIIAEIAEAAVIGALQIAAVAMGAVVAAIVVAQMVVIVVGAVVRAITLTVLATIANTTIGMIATATKITTTYIFSNELEYFSNQTVGSTSSRVGSSIAATLFVRHSFNNNMSIARVGK